MQMQKLIAALAGMAVVSEASVTFLDTPLSAALARRQNRGGQGGGNGGGGGGGGGGGNNNNELCLKSNVVATGSQQPGKPNAQQANSATDKANFINFCSGQDITNGQQKTAGSCNPIVQGKIPSQNNMVSTIIKNPPPGGNIQANKDFDIQLKVQGLQAGSFTDAQSTYYSAPQDLNQKGQIIGHVHVTVQDMGNSLTPANPLDPKQFVFFKGINDAGDGQGNLKATVTGGLPAGNYRVCSMSSASNHQPVMMPVAQRGMQDDCNKFTVGNGGGGGGGGGGGNGGGQGGGNGGGQGGGNGQQNGGKGQSGGQQRGTGSGAQTGKANTSGQDGGATNSGANDGNSGSGNGGAKANAIGGVQAPAVTDSGDSSRPFSVNGNKFESKTSAVQRACDIQRNGCLDAFNRGQLTTGSIAGCEAQVQACVQELS